MVHGHWIAFVSSLSWNYNMDGMTVAMVIPTVNKKSCI